MEPRREKYITAEIRSMAGKPFTFQQDGAPADQCARRDGV